jgi:hypothetical protein
MLGNGHLPSLFLGFSLCGIVAIGASACLGERTSRSADDSSAENEIGECQKHEAAAAQPATEASSSTANEPKPVKAPKLRMGATYVSGRLAPELVQRTVRQNFAKFRMCYEHGLAKNPTLAGKIVIEFTIAVDGSVTRATEVTNELPDREVAACVAKSFYTLCFDRPEGGTGTVKVTYPIMLAPG